MLLVQGDHYSVLLAATKTPKTPNRQLKTFQVSAGSDFRDASHFATSEVLECHIKARFVIAEFCSCLDAQAIY